MIRLSNFIITFLNVLTLLVSLLAIGYSLVVEFSPANHCQKVLQMPLLIIGIALLVVSLCGLIGSCCKVSFFMWVYLIVLFFLVIGLVCFTIFTIIVTNKSVSKVLSDKGVKDIRLGDYSGWLQKYVINAENWNHIKSCFVDLHFCQHISNDKGLDFYKHSLTPTQSGCCKPPNFCGFQFQNATYWIAPKGGPAVQDSDCQTWSNVQTELCFDCHSCKAAVLENIKGEWKILAIINACILVLVIVIYAIGCCALSNNRSAGYVKYRNPYPYGPHA